MLCSVRVSRYTDVAGHFSGPTAYTIALSLKTEKMFNEKRKVKHKKKDVTYAMSCYV